MSDIDGIIIELLDSGCSYTEIAGMYQTTRQYIDKMCHRINYQRPLVCKVRSLELPKFEDRHFGIALRYYRNLRAQILEQMAIDIGISSDTLKRYELGEDRCFEVKPYCILQYSEKLEITENELRIASGIEPRIETAQRVYINEDEKRFWVNVKESYDSCWIWTAAKDPKGYGRTQYKGKVLLSHRVSWMIHNGEIENSKVFVCHKCDNPSCVRPDHLFVGDNDENMLDMVAKGRSRVGSKHHNTKLTEDIVSEIKKMIDIEPLNHPIAKQFGTTTGIVSNIRRDVSWNHVP